MRSQLTLWHAEAFEVSLTDIETLQFSTGRFLYVTQQRLVSILLCSDIQYYTNNATCNSCPPSQKTLWMQQSECITCEQVS
jgi:hypothetical protein